MYELLKALDYMNSKGIMHLDIKPANIVIDPIKRKLTLIDFGCASFYTHGARQSSKVGTRAFKPPEAMIGLS